MTFSPLFRPRATLAAALLAGVSFAWHSSQDVAREERGWSVTRSGTESVALAPSPGLFRADGSVAGESVRYEATVQPPLPGRYRLHVSAENLAVNMQLGDTDGGEDAPSFEVEHAPETIGMNEHPAQAVRRKRSSSIVVGSRMVREGLKSRFLTGGKGSRSTWPRTTYRSRRASPRWYSCRVVPRTSRCGHYRASPLDSLSAAS